MYQVASNGILHFLFGQISLHLLTTDLETWARFIRETNSTYCVLQLKVQIAHDHLFGGFAQVH